MSRVVNKLFIWSGTTGVAALTHGRRFIGIDRELDYLERIAEPRLRDAETANKQDLFYAELDRELAG